MGSQGGASAASVYTDHKKRHLDTAAACAAQHVEFLPLVAETTGAWAPEAAKALDHISRAASHGSTLLQEACVLIRTWRARAALRRRTELGNFVVAGELPLLSSSSESHRFGIGAL